MAAPGLVQLQEEHREKRKAERKQAKTQLPAVSRVTSPKSRDEVADLEALFRTKALGIMMERFPRFAALLDSPDDKTAHGAWETAFKYNLTPRAPNGIAAGAGKTNIVFNFPDGDKPIDVTPRV